MAARYHGLDLLRGVAMLLGLVLHAGLVYEMPEIYGSVTGGDPGAVPERSVPGAILSLWIHMWRMPLFFLLSGFFAALVLGRRSAVAWAQDRLVRIVAPLFAFMLLFNLLTGQPWHQLNHYWFLYYLGAMCALTLVWRAVLPAAWAWPLRWVFGRVRRLWVLWPLMTVLTALGREGGMAAIIPDFLGDLPLGSFAYHYVWFVLGQGLYARRDALPRLCQGWCLAAAAALAAASFVALLVLSEQSNPAALTARNAAAALNTGNWCLLLIGAFERLVRGPSRIAAFLVETAYPVYLLHLLPAILISSALLAMGWGEPAVIAATTVGSFGASLILYWAFIKYTPVNWILAGYTRSWAKLPRWVVPRAG